MKVRLTVEVDDSAWPFLTVKRWYEGPETTTPPVEQRAFYDGAATQLETTVTYAFRRAVEHLIRARKGEAV